MCCAGICFFCFAVLPLGCGIAVALQKQIHLCRKVHIGDQIHQPIPSVLVLDHRVENALFGVGVERRQVALP